VEWPAGATLNLVIDDPNTPDPNDYSASAAVPEPDPDASTVVIFELAGIFDLQPGQIITVTDGISGKQTVVTELAFTSVDVLTDEVYGVAAIGSIVQVNNWDSPETWLKATTGMDGVWVVDFTDFGGIDYGTTGLARQRDEDRDWTVVDWETPSCPPGDSVSGHVWLADGVTPAPGATVMIEAYDQPHKTLLSFNTEPDGSYTCGLPDGVYRLSANSMNPPDTLFSSEYYPETIFENAAAVQVQSSSPRGGIDFTLDTPAYIFEHMTFNFNEPIIADIAVRQAIAFGADRQRMIDATYPASPFQDSILFTTYWPHTSQSLIQYVYDPAMARRILDQAGWVDADGDGVREKDGVRLHLKYATTDQEVRCAIADIFVENMQAIGVEVEVMILPPPITQWFTDHPDLSIAQFAWVQDVNQDDPQGMIWKQGSGNNFGGYANPSADQLLNLAALFDTRSEMKPYLEHYQRVVMADPPMLPLLLRIEILDRDGDGVPDGNDQCPDVSSQGYDVDQDGCLDTSQGLKDLINKLYADNEIKKAGTRDSLLSQVNKVETQLSKGNYTRAVLELDNFIKMVNDELKKKNLTQTAADQLIAYADSLKRWIDDKYIVGLGAGMERAWLPLFSPTRA
jgi:hypothetical protein